MTTYMQEELEACMEEKPLNTNVKVCYDRFVISKKNVSSIYLLKLKLYREERDHTMYLFGCEAVPRITQVTE